MANPKFIFKLTPNEKEVIINSSVLLNGYPDVEYPVPFIQTSLLGYIIDENTFKFVDPSILQSIQYPYPVKLEVELLSNTLPFYAINKEKHCDRIVIGDDGKYITGNEIAIFYNNGEYDATGVMIDCSTNGVNCFCVDPFQFNFKLYWSDNVGHGGNHFSSGDIDYKTPIPELSNVEQGDVYPFEVRITPVVNQSVINSLDSFLLPSVGEEPPYISIQEELNETFDVIFDHIDDENMLTGVYEIDMNNVPNIMNYLMYGIPEITQFKNNPARVEYVRNYLIKEINDRNVRKRKELLKHPKTLIINSSVYGIEEEKEVTCNVYENDVLSPRTFKTYGAWLPIPDNRETERREVAKFNINATMTDPRTLLSVQLNTTISIYQHAFPGNRTGYINMNYIDNHPLELWSPKVLPVYGLSKLDEANVKVNKGLNTEYIGFIVDDSVVVDPSKYTYAKLYKKNILPDEYIDPSSGRKIQVTANNINALINLAETNLDFYNNYVNILPLKDVSLMHYYYDPVYKDSSVFSDFDFVNFQKRYKWCYDIATDDKLVCTLYPKEQLMLFDYGLYTSDGKYNNKELDVSIPNNKQISFTGRYVARYARYKIIDKEYFQIIILNDNLEDGHINPNYGYIDDAVNDYDCTYYTISHQISSNIGNFNYIDPNSYASWENSSINSTSQVFGAAPITDTPYTNFNTVVLKDSYSFIQEPNDIANYKIVMSESGNSIQYKFCINDLLYDGSILDISVCTINSSIKTYVDVQVPRFGVYGTYKGLFAYDFDVYDYTSDAIPFIDLTSANDPVGQPGSTGTNSINDRLSEQGLHVIGESSTSIITDIGNMVTYQEGYTQTGFYGAPMRSMQKNAVLGAGGDEIDVDDYPRITLYLYNIPEELFGRLRVNGVPATKANFIGTHIVDPYIFMVSIDDLPDNYRSYVIDSKLVYPDNTTIDCSLLITNAENEKHLRNYTNKGNDIDTNLDSYMLLRTNPKLTGNIKLVVDTDYNIYLDTFKASPKLNDLRYRRQAVPADGNYPYDIKRIFATLPNTELFKVPENSMKAHKVYNDFNDQYETMYEYGAETNTDNLYPENMKILAPLHIGKDVPDFFTVFRYNEVVDVNTFNNENYLDVDKFKELLSKSEVVATYDLRQYTSIGQYLNNYKDMLTNYGQCYLQFIEQDNFKLSRAYRQGTNIWKGISINRGILTNQSETSYFAEKILSGADINRQELFNSFIMQGFERNNLLYPNIINLEFMFNDNSQEEYSMHRYFGLYLTLNDFIKYGYVIPDQTKHNVLKKYDVSGNLYRGDDEIYHLIFNSDYASRLFYAVTNDYADRVKSENDVNDFLSAYIKNTPEKNMLNIKANFIEYADNDKSFITLHFSEPIKYGEHIKFIALNKPVDNTAYTNIIDPTINELSYEHIVLEIIASNNEYLKYTDDYISPVENYNDCVYSENTSFYRISFYSQDLDYPEVSASIEDLIQRIVSCINAFNTFIHIGNYNKSSISIFSEYDEMYLQHIAAHDFDDFKYDYVSVKNNNFILGLTLYTTNTDCVNSIEFIVQDPSFVQVYDYDQVEDEYNDWLQTPKTTNTTNWTCYVEAEDPVNVKKDSISYFNAFEQFDMHALTNQSDYFDGYYAAFCNYGFETIGWRYNTVVKFMKVQDMKNNYALYNDEVYNFIKKVKYPIVMTDDNMYETMQMFNVSTGYLRNNIMDPDLYESYTSEQQFIFENIELQVITSPYDVNHAMIMSLGDALLKNNMVLLYKPKYANISIMGISNIKDIDTIVDSERTVHKESKLTLDITANETLYLDESDYRIQHGVMYELVNGTIAVKGTEIDSPCKFIVIPDTDPDTDSYLFYYTKEEGNTLLITGCEFIMAKSNVRLKIIDKQKYQEYDYTTEIPVIHSDNLYKDPTNTDNSELLYPITPLVNCNWKSNGLYYDFNNTLDVSNLKLDYEYIGNFVENVYTPAPYETNQYVTNKIDSAVYIDGNLTTYRNAILNGECQHPIKKLLIDNVNIDTAVAYYNSNVQSLEFIFSGIKFEIKLNSKLVNTHIHLDAYDNFEVFVINDYNVSKKNEMFISLVERFILLINHSFYIDYAHEAVNNIKTIQDGIFKPYQEYSACWAPYSIDFRTFYRGWTYPVVYRKDDRLSVMDAIDKHNLWSSYFIQTDIPLIDVGLAVFNNTNSPRYIQSKLISISEYGKYVTFNQDYNNSHIGISDNGSGYDAIVTDPSIIGGAVVSSKHVYQLNDSISIPYVVTKADGDYNTLAKKLVDSLNFKIEQVDTAMRAEYSGTYGTSGIYGADDDPTNDGDNTTFNAGPTNRNAKRDFSILSMQTRGTDEYNIDLDEDLFITYDDRNKYVVEQLSSMMDTPFFWLVTKDKRISKYRNYYIPKTYLTDLQNYIKLLLISETHQEKLLRYVKSFNNDVDVYIIPIDAPVLYIQNTLQYNPLIFNLSVPNMIKYNYGWFTPNTIRMMDFSVDDPLRDILDVDLLQSNTNVTGIHRIINYTGNKVFDDNKLYTLNKNYFMIPERSLLSTTWDGTYYRKYSDENNYMFYEGHITGIDDKSFFGSRCMVMHHDYILIDKWQYNTANDILTYVINDSHFNVESVNTHNTVITINMTTAIFNHFINNNVFADNWNFFNDTLYTGMRNYINNTLTSYFNMFSNIEVIVYKKDTIVNEPINILLEKPADINSYTIIEGLDVSEPEIKEDFYTITVVVPYSTGMDIYPTIKIYRR